MSRRRRDLLVGLLAVAAFLLTVPLGAWASEAAHPVFSWKKEALKTFNFLVVVGVLWWLLKDRLPKFLDERRQKIEKTINDAKTARAEAEAKRVEYEAKIERAERDIAEIEAEGARRIEAMRAELAQAAEAAAERIATEAEERISSEVKRAKEELQREASLLALELSEELIKERMSEEDQRKLVDETIRKLESLK